MSKRNTARYEEKRNARRVAQRRIAGLMERMQSTTSAAGRARLTARISSLESAIEATQVYDKLTGKQVRTAEEAAAATASLKALNEQTASYARGSRQAAANKARNETTAGMIGVSSLSWNAIVPKPYTNAQVKLFYSLTQDIWNKPGVSMEQRNQAIMDYYGANSLQEVFDELTGSKTAREVIDAVEVMLSQMIDPGSVTEEQLQWADEVLSRQDYGELFEHYRLRKSYSTERLVDAPGF